jgi:murein L,D-transpeptidase YcbB/YkuD
MESRRSALVVATLFVVVASPLNWWARRGPAPAPVTSTDDAALAATIRTILAASGAAIPATADLAEVNANLASLYGPADPPLWIHEGRPNAAAAAAVGVVQSAASDGLTPSDYDAAWLQQRLQELGTGTPASTMDLGLFEVTLSTEVLRFLTHLHRGRVPPARVGFAYAVDGEGDDLGPRLRRAAREASVETLATELRPPFSQYVRLRRALARYRAEECSEPVPTRRIRKLELALERLRWLPHPLPRPFLVANVPAYRLVAFQTAMDDAPALQMPIVVGRAARTPTPLFADEVSSVIFRPYWYPPPSIIRNEIVPALARDPRYLARQHMDVVAATSDTSPALAVTSETLSRLRSGRLALRQRPGPHNALGLVKFVFPNDYRVYMHDTPARALFGRARRDFSHGCIRVERPADLAAFVLAGQPGWTADRIAAAMAGDRTIRANVSPPIPVFIFYTTAIVRADDTVEFFDDVYGLDARLERELAARAVHDASAPRTHAPHAKEIHAQRMAP